MIRTLAAALLLLPSQALAQSEPVWTDPDEVLEQEDLQTEEAPELEVAPDEAELEEDLDRQSLEDPPETNPVALPGGEAKSGVTPQALSLPTDGGSVEGLGESFSPLLSSGTATFSVPVALPPGRRGTQPGLSFSYSSSAGNGTLGIGWSLAVPFISRQTDKGLPRYDGTDRFMYNGGQELVEVAPTADDVDGMGATDQPESLPEFVDDYRYFRARIEGAYLRFFLAPDESHWIVEDKDGTFFYLGETDASRIEHPNWGTYLWSLTRVIDIRGNEVRYGYRAKDSSRQVYLEHVFWNSPVVDGEIPFDVDDADFQHAVTLTYEERIDDIDSYISRFRVTMGLRLVQIDVESRLSGEDALRTLDRAYFLSYDPESFLSLLESIEVQGRDGTTLPPMTFGYAKVEPAAPDGGDLDDDLDGWGGFDGRVTELANSPDHSMDEARTDLFDVDADAFPDVLVTDPARFDDGHGVFFLDWVDGVGTYTPSDIIEVPRSIGGDLTLSNANVNPMDLDADGRVELLHMPHVREWSAFSAEGNRDDGFAWVEKGPYDPAHDRIDFTREADEIRLADVDNDHRIDVLRTSGTRFEMFRNAGDGTFEAPVTSCVLHRGMPLRFSNGDLQLADMNGDGLQDLVHVKRGDLAYWPGRGDGLWGGDADLPEDCTEGEFGDDREIVMEDTPFWSDLEDDRIRLSDVNADGLTDLVQTRFSGVDIWVNEGGRTFTDRYIIDRSPFDPMFTQRVRLCDINATGSRDILWGDGEHYKYMDLTGGIRPRLLVSVENGLGKTTTLDYEAHTAQQSRAADEGEPWATVAPFPVQVVSRMTATDGLGGTYVTEYEYRDALYDGLEAEFRGFGEAIVRTIGDANSPTSEQRTVFWQGERPAGSDPEDNPLEAMKGAVKLTETCDLGGVCLETSAPTWRVRKLYDGINGDPRSVWQAFTNRSHTWRYDTAPFEASDDVVEVAAIIQETEAGNVQTNQFVPVRGAGWVRLRGNEWIDSVGNQIQTDALGIVGDTSDDIVSWAEFDNLGDWLWRPVLTATAAPPGFDPVFNATTISYTALGEVEEQSVVPEEGDEILQVHNTYNGIGQVVLVEEGGVEEAALRRREMAYDPDFSAYLAEEKIYTTEEDFVTTQAVWDAGLGVITEFVDFNSESTMIEYDGLARVETIHRPGCGEPAVAHEYLLAGDMGKNYNEVVTRSNETCDEVDPTSVETSLESHAFVDGLGRARMTFSEADPEAGDAGDWVRSGLVAFDAKGAASRAYLPDFRDDAEDLFNLTPPGDGYTSTRYDAFGREQRSVAPDRVAATETRYHALSRDVWDPNDLDVGSGHYGTPTTFEEDGQGRLLAVTERNIVEGVTEEYVTSYTYDVLNDLLTIDRTFDETTVHRELAYDLIGRRVVNTDPDSGEWTYEYSDVGDLVATVDARDVRVAYEYDLAGRLIEEDYDDDDDPGEGDVTYVFDDVGVSGGLGRLTHVGHAWGWSNDFEYDERGRVVSETADIDSARGPWTETNTYDELDRQVDHTYPDDSVATYEYSARGLLVGVVLEHEADDTPGLDEQVVVASIEYNASGQRREEVLGDGAATTNTYEYDRRLRLSRMTSISGEAYRQDWQYVFDRASNIVEIRDLRTAEETDGWSPSPADQEYAYDALYRLVRNRTTYEAEEPTRPTDQRWSYDFLGNMKSWTDDAEDFWERSLGTIENGVDTDPDVRPDAIVHAEIEAGSELDATYNASGDMESLTVDNEGTTTVNDYQWDQVHRLKATNVDIDSVRAWEVLYGYDFADQRRLKVEFPEGLSANYQDTLYPFGDYEIRCYGSGCSGGNVPTKWVHVGAQKVLRVEDTGEEAEVSFYLGNHLGTTSVVLDGDGEPRSAAMYLPYGALDSEEVIDPGFEALYRFSGKERDNGTGVDYFGARYCGANLGRWLSPDPLAVHALDVGPMTNPFAYVLGNPLRLVDPTGLQATGGDNEEEAEVDVADDASDSDADPAPDAPDDAGDTGSPTETDAQGQGGTEVSDFLPVIMPSTVAGHMRDPSRGTVPALRLQAQAANRAAAATNAVTRRTAVASLGGQAIVAAAPAATAVTLGATELTQTVATQVAVRAPALAAAAQMLTRSCSDVAPPTPGARVAAEASDHIVLGLRAFGVEETASAVGGRTLLSDPSWRDTLRDALGSSSTRLTVSLEGFTGNTVYAQIMGAVERGLGPNARATEWEMAQIYQAGRMATVNFVDRAGRPIGNPLTGQ